MLPSVISFMRMNRRLDDPADALATAGMSQGSVRSTGGPLFSTLPRPHAIPMAEAEAATYLMTYKKI